MNRLFGYRIDPPAEEEIIFINENRLCMYIYIYIVYNQLTGGAYTVLVYVCGYTNIYITDNMANRSRTRVINTELLCLALRISKVRSHLFHVCRLNV